MLKKGEILIFISFIFLHFLIFSFRPKSPGTFTYPLIISYVKKNIAPNVVRRQLWWKLICFQKYLTKLKKINHYIWSTKKPSLKKIGKIQINHCIVWVVTKRGFGVILFLWCAHWCNITGFRIFYCCLWPWRGFKCLGCTLVFFTNFWLLISCMYLEANHFSSWLTADCPIYLKLLVHVL